MKIAEAFKNKTVRLVLVCLGALLLLLAAWAVFFKSSDTTPDYQPTAQEERIRILLSKIEGVGNATVLIGEENGIPVSAVVVFDGADSFLTRMRVMEVTASALSIGRDRVLVYPAEG